MKIEYLLNSDGTAPKLTDAQERILLWWMEDCMFKKLFVYRIDGQIRVHYIDSFDEHNEGSLKDVLIAILRLVVDNAESDMRSEDYELVALDAHDINDAARALLDLEGTEC